MQEKLTIARPALSSEGEAGSYGIENRSTTYNPAPPAEESPAGQEVQLPTSPEGMTKGELADLVTSLRDTVGKQEERITELEATIAELSGGPNQETPPPASTSDVPDDKDHGVHEAELAQEPEQPQESSLPSTAHEYYAYTSGVTERPSPNGAPTTMAEAYSAPPPSESLARQITAPESLPTPAPEPEVVVESQPTVEPEPAPESIRLSGGALRLAGEKILSTPLDSLVETGSLQGIAERGESAYGAVEARYNQIYKQCKQDRAELEEASRNTEEHEPIREVYNQITEAEALIGDLDIQHMNEEKHRDELEELLKKQRKKIKQARRKAKLKSAKTLAKRVAKSTKTTAARYGIGAQMSPEDQVARLETRQQESQLAREEHQEAKTERLALKGKGEQGSVNEMYGYDNFLSNQLDMVNSSLIVSGRERSTAISHLDNVKKQMDNFALTSEHPLAIAYLKSRQTDHALEQITVEHKQAEVVRDATAQAYAQNVEAQQAD